MNPKTIFIFCFVWLFGCTSQKHYIGEQYLGAKYLNDPLGEGMAPDTDPLIRTDAFDCMTFVETALANGDLDKLTKIRYKNGQIDFLHRNHFVETDWMQNNADLLENVSHQYGQTETKTFVIDKKSWFKKTHHINTNFAKQYGNIEYIPLINIQQIKTDTPLIVLFISGNSKFYDKIETDLAVVHMGFLLPDGRLRHASQTKGRVVDTDFNEYINNRKQHKNNIGIALVRIK